MWNWAENENGSGGTNQVYDDGGDENNVEKIAHQYL